MSTLLILFSLSALDVFFLKTVVNSSKEQNAMKFFNKLCMLNTENEVCLNKQNDVSHIMLKKLDNQALKRKSQSSEEISPQNLSKSNNHKPVEKKSCPESSSEESSKELMDYLPPTGTTEKPIQNVDEMIKGLCELIPPPTDNTIKWISIFNNLWDGNVEIEWKKPKKRRLVTQYVIEFATILEENWIQIAVLSVKQAEQHQDTMKAEIRLFYEKHSSKMYELRVRSQNTFYKNSTCVSEPSNVVLVGINGPPTNCVLSTLSFNNNTWTIGLDWRPPIHRGVISEYHIEYAEMYRDNWKRATIMPESGLPKQRELSVSEVLTKTFTLNDFNSNKTYAYRVKAKTDYKGNVWLSEPSNIAWAAKPYCPRAKIEKLLDMNVIDNVIIYKKVYITWQPPESNGNSDIRNYVIEYKLREKTKWEVATTVDGKKLSAEVPTKEKTNLYEFRVSATNLAGMSDNCTSDYIGRPGKPKNFKIVKILAENNTLKLEWTPPKNCGNRECSTWYLVMYPLAHVSKLLKGRLIVPLAFMHFIFIHDAKPCHDHTIRYDLRISDLNTTDQSGDPKLKINLKDKRNYYVVLRTNNGHLLSKGKVVAETNPKKP